MSTKSIDTSGAFVSFGLRIVGKNGGFELAPALTPSLEAKTNRIWISRVGGTHDGEGADFSADALLEALNKFYNEQF